MFGSHEWGCGAGLPSWAVGDVMTLKHFVLGLSFFLGLQSAHAELGWNSNPGPPHFCMQNFNAYGPIYALNMEERTQWMVAELYGKPRCEIVHLQEVWNQDQIDIVEDGLKSLYNISAPNRQEKIGVMSLLMADIKNTETYDFNVNSDGNLLDVGREIFNVKKAFHIVKASLFGIDEEFYFMNTHLHPTSSAVRLTQILDLLDWRLAHTDLKLLLSGDFNGDENSLERSVIMSLLGVRDSLVETLGGSYPKGVCTYCAENPLGWLSGDHVLDYIFFSNVGGGATHLKALDGKINLRGTPDEPLSDHYGLRIDFVLDAAKTATASEVIEQRRAFALKLLARMEKVLAEEEDEDFTYYQKKARKLRAQLERREGAFNEYFEKFN